LFPVDLVGDGRWLTVVVVMCVSATWWGNHWWAPCASRLARTDRNDHL